MKNTILNRWRNMQYFSRFLIPKIVGSALLITYIATGYIAAGIDSGKWAISKQLEYQRQNRKLYSELIALADRNGDHELSAEERRDLRKRAGLDPDKIHLWLAPEVMERAIESYKTDLNKEG